MIFSPLFIHNKRLIMDIERWNKTDISLHKKIALLLYTKKEFRNLFIYRNRYPMKSRSHKIFCRWIKFWYRPIETLYIECSDIGGGFYIQHGFATFISAKSIGENCWINQQVTIGYNSKGECPVIGNNVTVTCGAKVLGDIVLGDKMVVGANAVVVKSFPKGNAIIAGVPAKEIRRYMSHPDYEEKYE